VFTLILITSFALQAPESKSETPAGRGAKAGEPGSKTEVAAATPEQALRSFVIAMMTKDETTLRAVTLHTEDFDWLLRGQALPEDQIEDFKAQITRQPIRALKAGDEITLPGNRKVKVLPEEVTADRAVLVPQGAPFPTRLRMIDGRWRVDATPMIAGRKAAEAARQKTAKPADRK
jgi:hypothetical protein